jgi:hypothetical protein
MPRKFLIVPLTAAFLAMPAFAPVTMSGLSGSAVAKSTVKSSRSNADGRTSTFNNTRQNTWRMGGGGGGRTK